ncbi:MAG: hypothetical protein IPN10_18115 [Saprospiraceae bacterium]|nr:hypothetical protein [Saprospiraceae bacterium]MBP6695350.1 hypothetical protein [Saprospiraceae bacterium]
MKHRLTNILFRLTITGLFVLGFLIFIVLNPGLMYANKTKHRNYSIYHNNPLDPSTLVRLEEVTDLVKRCEWNNPELPLGICLNDDSMYPKIIKTLLGEAFARGFYNKVVIHGTTNFKEDYVELHGYKWNLTQLLAHEIIHCLQYAQLGFMKSNPLADIPDWKWEGYPEYISRQNVENIDLKKNISKLKLSNSKRWEIEFEDGTISSREYYQYWILMQYCMDIKKMNYQQILKDTMSDSTVKQQMMEWYEMGK